MPTRTCLLLASLSLLACAGQLEATVRSQAAQDLACPEGQVVVRDLRSDNYVRDFDVSGCGQHAHYQAACSMVGSCTAYRAEELGKHRVPGSDALTVGHDDLRPAESGAEAKPAEVAAAPAEPEVAGAVAVERDATELGAARLGAAPTEVVTATASGPAPSGEARAVTLRNACPRTVPLFVGAQPGEEGGRYMTLGAGNTISPKLRAGEQLWLLDNRQAGLVSVSIDGSTREVEIAESCSGLAAR